VLASFAIRAEIDLLPSLLRHDRIEIYLPVSIEDRTDMEFYLYAKNCQKQVELIPGPYGILEPERKIPYRYQEGDIIIVPCLGVNKNGYRLGRGKGYYDRQYNWIQNLNRLAVLPESVVGLDFQHQGHDLRLNTIVTEERIVEVRDYG
jgi:5-formyltetrahydrofolate cyclo-ligase